METLNIIAICIVIAVLIGGAAIFFAFWWMDLIYRNRDEERIMFYDKQRFNKK